MKAIIKAALSAVIVLDFAGADLFAAMKTTGTPLGGMGAAYIAYNAVTGKFAKGYRLSGQHWYHETTLSAGFHLYTKTGNAVKTVNTLKSDDENAFIPIYRVNYAATNNVVVQLLAFGPYVTGDEKSSVMPLAFFEFIVKNRNTEAAEAAIALEIGNLAGGSPTRLTTANGVGWSGEDNSTVMASSDINGATITTGSLLAEFNSAGALSNINGGIVAIKANLAPLQIGRFRFVVGWYQEFSANDWNGTLRNEGFYYQTYVANSAEAADYGMTNFVRIRDGAVAFVDRIRAVNLPDWYTDRLLNNLYPLTHNSQFAKDGRVAWRKGKYYIIGSTGQQGHAQIAASYNWPDGQWRQMEYLARTQWQGDYAGQIHHDFNGPRSGSEKIDAMCTWDDYNHSDYWFSKTKNWSDLNSFFIINCYELFLATGDVAKLTKMWDALKLTGARLLTQAQACIDNLPITPPIPDFVLPNECLGSYDREGTTNEYNASLALNAYACLKEMALGMGDTTGSEKWDSIFTLGKTQFSQLYSSKSDYGTKAEGQLGAYSFSRHLGLPVIMSDAEAFQGFNRFRDTKSQNDAYLAPWHFFTVSHFGDMGIALGEVDKGLIVHKADYDQFCVKDPRYYFWQDLDDKFDMNTFMTAPVVWRSYFLISGYCMDKFNKRLWLRPMLPTENNGKLTKAPLISPGNWGTMNYTETEKGKTQQISVRFDSPMELKELCLKNPDGVDDTVNVKNAAAADIAFTAAKSGTGLDCITRLTFASPVSVTTDGIYIGVNAEPPASVRFVHSNRNNSPVSMQTHFKSHTIQVDFSLDKTRDVTIDIFSVTGVRIATMSLGVKAEGIYSINSNHLASGVYMIRLRSGNAILATSSGICAH